MLVERIGVEERDGESVLHARVSTAREDGSAFTLEYGFQGLPASVVARTGEPFVAALLLPAMAMGEDLEVAAPLSPRFLRNVDTALDIYSAWARGLPRVRVLGGRGEAAPSDGGGAALFFSAGVDSFYSLLKAERPSAGPSTEVTHLLFVHGFDIELHDMARRAMVAAHVERVAEATGKRPLFVRSNLRELVVGLVSWELHHGAALASVGLALPGHLNRCVIPSSWAYQNLQPWGSHPLLDPLWSTESVEFVHDGCESTRIEKVRTISRSPLVLDNLRVCWEYRTDDYNCARCEKCIATMAMLQSEGVLGASATFPRHLDPRQLWTLRFKDPATFSRLRDLLESMQAKGADPELAHAIERVLLAGRVRLALRRARRRGLARAGPLRRIAGALRRRAPGSPRPVPFGRPRAAEGALSAARGSREASPGR